MTNSFLDAAAQSPEAALTVERDGRERLRLLDVGFAWYADALANALGKPLRRPTSICQSGGEMAEVTLARLPVR